MINNIEEKLKKVKLLAMDFDGVMTDGCVYVSQDGVESVRCSRKDGLGIELLKKYGITAVVISKEVNPVVTVRCKKLNIDCYQAVQDSDTKFEILERIIKEKNIDPSQVAYMGDDLNDIQVFKNVNLAITVADGHESLKELSHYITEAKGGDHAVREVCEKILIAQGVNLTF